jgi:hypothetical protein
MCPPGPHPRTAPRARHGRLAAATRGGPPRPRPSRRLGGWAPSRRHPRLSAAPWFPPPSALRTFSHSPSAGRRVSCTIRQGGSREGLRRTGVVEHPVYVHPRARGRRGSPAPCWARSWPRRREDRNWTVESGVFSESTVDLLHRARLPCPCSLRGQRAAASAGSALPNACPARIASRPRPQGRARRELRPGLGPLPMWQPGDGPGQPAACCRWTSSGRVMRGSSSAA